jgi:pyruvate ferredoxin oxidoreductase gamma subunit
VPNVPQLAGFAASSGGISLDAAISAVRDTFSGTVAAGSIAAASGAYEASRRRPTSSRRSARW